MGQAIFPPLGVKPEGKKRKRQRRERRRRRMRRLNMTW